MPFHEKDIMFSTRYSVKGDVLSKIRSYNDNSDYEPSSSDLEDLRHSLLYLKVLEQLKEIRDGLTLERPEVYVLLDSEYVYGLPVESSKTTSNLPVITMNDTDSLLESTAEHLLKGKE